MTRKSVARCCVFPEVHTPTHAYAGSPVYLNVYDLSPMNIGYLYWAGIGIFHSGVEVHGVEYAFGSIKYPASGIFKVEPRQCPGYKFKKSIYIGTTFLDPFQVKELMKLKSESYYGHTYHLLTKNCNHFSDDVCSKLTGSSIPKWVNRLARLGSFCICIIPEILEPIRVCHSEKDNDPDNEKVSLRMSNASSRICPLVHHCTLETGVSSSFASPERMSTLKSEFVAALDKNAKLKKQIRELTEKLRLAEQGLDSAVLEIIKNQARKSDRLQ